MAKHDGGFLLFICHPEKLPVFKKMEMLNLSFSLNISDKVNFKYIYRFIRFNATPLLCEASNSSSFIEKGGRKGRRWHDTSFSSNFLLQFILSTTAQRTLTEKLGKIVMYF